MDRARSREASSSHTRIRGTGLARARFVRRARSAGRARRRSRGRLRSSGRCPRRSRAGRFGLGIHGRYRWDLSGRFRLGHPDHHGAPPPGVSSTSSSPPTASTNPRATARPSPTPPRLLGVAQALERLEHPIAVLGAIPGPRSMTRMSTRPATAPASMRSPLPPAWTSALSMRLATARSSSTGSVRIRGSGESTDHDHLVARGPRLSTAASMSSPTSVLWSRTSIEPVWSRLMSNRFSTRLFNRSASSSMVCEQDPGLVGPEARAGRRAGSTMPP